MEQGRPAASAALLMLVATWLSAGATTSPPEASPSGVSVTDVPAAATSPARRVERVEEQRVDGGASGEVTETQHTVCEVSTEELAAKATATVTRVLTGLCNAKEMEQRFGAMEAQLARVLEGVRAALLALEDRLQEQDAAARRVHTRMLAATLKCVGAPGSGAPLPTGRRFPAGGGSGSATDVGGSPVEMEVDGGAGAATEAANLETASEIGVMEVPPRADEIERYNSTIHTLAGGRRVFTYYWRVPQITHKLSRWPSERSIRSPSFYTSQGGYRMYLRLVARRGGDNVFVHAGLTPGAFDDTLVWPFALKLRVSVLEQTPAASEDLTSRVWDATELCGGSNWQRPQAGDGHECVGLGLPHSLMRQRSYMWRDSVLVKLTVFLA